jgi:inner membrane protein
MPETIRLPTRSAGLKFLLVCVLAAVMAIPAYMIFALIYDRTERAAAVVQEVGERNGGEQSFTGPIVVVPYKAVTTPAPTPEQPRPLPVTTNGWYVVFAKTGTADASAKTDVKTRGMGGLFKVRTYTADVAFKSAFDLTNEPAAAPENAVIDWSRAAILIGVTDARGAKAPAAIEVAGQNPLPLEPGSAYAGLLSGGRTVQWLVADAGAFVKPGVTFDASTKLRFTGVESLSLTAFARDTEMRIRGDWTHIDYRGAFQRLDADKLNTAQPANSFDAKWSVPYIARNLAQSGDANVLSALTSLDGQVRFVDPANPYQSVSRALKYALLFLSLVFLAYFLLEATNDRRVHPAQYILVGLAQIVFYLLLLAIAERVGFDLAFLIAAGATVALIGTYAGAVFQSRKLGIGATAAFAALYALIYMLMRLEDFALLVGSVAAFLAILAAMYFTRNLDWYGLNRNGEAPR